MTSQLTQILPEASALLVIPLLAKRAFHEFADDVAALLGGDLPEGCGIAPAHSLPGEGARSLERMGPDALPSPD